MSAPVQLPSWPELLTEAVIKPGVISDAYSRFWSYSPGNQLLAWYQCAMRGLELGPINTFHGWNTVGRNVQRGAKAITLCMPVQLRCRKHDTASPDVTTDSETAAQPAESTFTRFLYRPHWFVLCQTEGREYVPVAVPEWSEEIALQQLSIVRIAFKHPDGNAQGYAQSRQVAVSPVAFMPHRTLFHEIAHVVLGHTSDAVLAVDDAEPIARDAREVEAECVAMLVCSALGFDGAEFSRGYIQHWLGSAPITERSAQRIFKAADTVLRAGRPTVASSL